jgi:hypothetical protein
MAAVLIGPHHQNNNNITDMYVNLHVSSLALSRVQDIQIPVWARKAPS